MKINIITIIKKEFARFFKDPRMVLSTIILPGLLIYVLYSFMGSGLMDSFSTDETYEPKVSVCHMPESMAPVFEELSFSITEVTEEQLEEEKAGIQNKSGDLLIVFPQDFDAQVAAYESLGNSRPAPEVKIYYNSSETESQAAYQTAVEVLDQYEATLSNKFDVNRSEELFDMATEKDTTGQIFAMLVPMLLMIFIFSSCMSVAPEAIAGEKERGTIATLLVTPIKRSELAFGKIISLSVISLLGGLSSFLGTMFSMPKLMGAASDSMDLTVYTPTDYVLLLLVVLSSVLIIISLISIISAFSKSVKEASTAVMPLMVLVMLISITSMMGGGAPEELFWYFVPLYNSVQCMSGIFSFTYTVPNMVAAIASNFVYAAILAFVLARLFNNEKVMFSR